MRKLPRTNTLHRRTQILGLNPILRVTGDRGDQEQCCVPPRLPETAVWLVHLSLLLMLCPLVHPLLRKYMISPELDTRRVRALTQKCPSFSASPQHLHDCTSHLAQEKSVPYSSNQNAFKQRSFPNVGRVQELQLSFNVDQVHASKTQLDFKHPWRLCSHKMLSQASKINQTRKPRLAPTSNIGIPAKANFASTDARRKPARSEAPSKRSGKSPR